MFPFEVDSTTDVPLWVQLRRRLIYLINSGYFKPVSYTHLTLPTT